MLESSSPQRLVALAAITIYILASIFGARYIASEILRFPDTQNDFITGAILLVLLAPLALYLHHTDDSRHQ